MSDSVRPVEPVIPAVALQPAVGLEQARRDAGSFGGAPERLRIGGSGSQVMTRASCPAGASLPGSRQSWTSAMDGRQGRSTAGGGAMSMPASRARSRSPNAGRGSESAAMAP